MSYLNRVVLVNKSKSISTNKFTLKLLYQSQTELYLNNFIIKIIQALEEMKNQKQKLCLEICIRNEKKVVLGDSN